MSLLVKIQNDILFFVIFDHCVYTVWPLIRCHTGSYYINWINSWLSGRTQQVVLDGQASDPVPVLSCVPQGSVLGPILFLIFMNDLPDNIRPSVCLLADDWVLYRKIYSIQDCLTLQEDLTSLGQWEAD